MRIYDLMILVSKTIDIYLSKMKNIYSVFLVFLIGCYSSDNRILVTNSGKAQGSFYHIKYLSEEGINIDKLIGPTLITRSLLFIDIIFPFIESIIFQLKLLMFFFHFFYIK